MRWHLLLSLLISSTALADSLHTCEHCAKHLLPAITQITPGRKYARDRRVDIEHLKLDVTPDFVRRTVAGTMTMTFSPIGLPLDKLELDAVDLAIADVQVTGAQLAEWVRSADKLALIFAAPIAPGTHISITIQYSAEPTRGLYFRTPEMGYKPGDTQVWTQGEADLHRFWFPCYDYPNERFTSEVICHAPKGMEVVSNGRLLSTTDAGDLTTWHWLQDKPHVNYLIALAAGFFHKIEDKAGTIPLALLVPPSHKDQAANAFADTRKIIEFFEKEIGVPFPWDKYYQVFCHDFLAGGMENTSCTFEASSLLFNSDTENLRSLYWLDAHETAHQWFGDLVTCRDWSHLWLNEGFASYYTVLYEEEKNGHDAMLYSLWQEAEDVLDAKDTRPTVWRDYGDPMQQFDTRVYPKGAWILHMLRSQLGPDLYRLAIRTYLERHRNGIVSTDDLHKIVEEVSGLSFDAFFDQWLYHGGFPELKVDYAWDAATKQAKITVKQTQKVTDQARLFQFPLPVGFTVKGQKEPLKFTMKITQAEEEFYFALPAQPELLRVDPDYTVLAKVDFTPPGDMLDKQLASDVIGRLLAATHLGTRKDQASVDKLAALLKEDPMEAIRTQAARSLAKIANPAARAALIASLPGQPNARCRLAVVEALSSIPHPDAQQALMKHAETEKNPGILTAIIRSWGTRPGDAAVATALARQLTTPSYQNAIAAAAISAYRAQDEPSATPAILKTLQEDPLGFRTRDYANALDTLAFLSRKEENRDEIRSFLINHLTHPKEELRTAAAKALGVLRDPKALAVLQAMLPGAGPYADPTREAASKSIQTLQAEQTGSAELKNLWNEVQQLQKKTEALQKQLGDSKKKATPTKK
ncbi:aminopeptidase N [Prosthecobacter fusiformis]|uniref:Aminopeptidase N n=1 Tax=Prosthecobacter fusiformis TaxID=48464 RepID=A0A4R7SPK7_9BACT|nr:M1 family aminopeptidase [Prosthecobacter fusiformis]TDU80844.1 aminopeptidase N [Prosthecobacter fusiformis]